MRTKTTPAGTGVISGDALEDGIENKRDHTTKNTFGKYFKPPPFADRIYKHSKLWHVYVGEDSIERAANIYDRYGIWHRIAAMALPWGENPFDFDWPVQEKTLDILSVGKHSSKVYQLGCALHQCGAAHVFGRVNGDIVHWHNDRLEAA